MVIHKSSALRHNWQAGPREEGGVSLGKGRGKVALREGRNEGRINMESNKESCKRKSKHLTEQEIAPG